MTQGKEIRLGKCDNKHCPDSDKRGELAEYKIFPAQVIGLCVKCMTDGIQRVQAREKQDEAEGVRRTQA